jgi:hypothetical protein
MRTYLSLILLATVCSGCSGGGSSSGGGGGPSCGNPTVPLNQQVANPISHLSTNNNGLTLQFPFLSTTYANTVTGYAILGVATQTNNTPATSANIPNGTTFYTLPADTNFNDNCYSYFQSIWGGNTICGFIDSGSSSMVFPNQTSSPISYDSNPNDQYYQFYTPASPTFNSATNVGFGGSPSVSTAFAIENVNSNFANYNVFSQWGVLDANGPVSGEFDFGLPFFLGRTVFVGLEGASSSLGTGTYWSYPASLNSASLVAPTGSNVMPVTIGGYGNEPYVSVTICVPGTSNCTTIPHVLLDTGSSGLRLFNSALPTGFAALLPGNSLGECISYGDNSTQWGSVQTADVQLGQQTASSVPIHVINTAFGDGGASCYSNLAAAYLQLGYVSVNCPSSTTADESNTPGDPAYGCPYFDSPSTFYNGILGVNFLAQDCGDQCASNPTDLYYSCSQ